MVDLTMHWKEVTPMRVSFAADLAELTELKGSQVSLTGDPAVTIEDSAGNDVTDDWGDPGAVRNGEAVDLMLDPPDAAFGVFDVTVECAHDGWAAGRLVGLLEDPADGVTRVVKVQVIA